METIGLDKVKSEKLLDPGEFENYSFLLYENLPRVVSINSISYLFRVRVIFAGDDVTDEDAMRALKVFNQNYYKQKLSKDVNTKNNILA